MKYLKYIMLLSMIGVLPSCNDFLEEDVFSDLSPANFYNTEADALAAVNAAYNNLQIYGNEWWNTGLPFMNVTDGSTDIMVPHWYEAWENLTYTSGNGDILNLWNWVYNTVNKCNSVIENIQNIEMNADLKNRLEAETKFIRGLVYFYAVQWWGDVPMILKEINGFDDIEQVTRTSKDQVYDQIITNLIDAKTVLPISYNANEAGRVTRGAASALLGKVYLTRGWGGSPNNINTADLASAVKEFEELMTSPYSYMLAENVRDVFNFTMENNPSLGHIFSVQYSQGLGFEGTWLAQNMQAVELENAWWGYAAPESWVQGPDGFQHRWEDDIFIPEDLRLEVLFEDYNGLYWFHWCKKWGYSNYQGWAEHPQNFTLLRFADVLLSHSEALNELRGGPNAEVVASINKVRERAGVPPYDPAEWTRESFRDEIQDERNRELWGEAHSWFDYVRKGIFVERMKAAGIDHVTEKFYLLPVPKQEIDNNPQITQNSGW